MRVSSAGVGAGVDHSFRRRGALTMGLFALAWAVAGSSALDSGVVADLVSAVALVITAIVIGTALWVPPTFASDRVRRLPRDWKQRFNRVGMLQSAGIVLVVVLLGSSRAALLVPAAICMLVGAHFFPLVSVFDQPQYRWTGAALCGVAILGSLAYAVDADSSRVVVGLGAASVLWATSLHVAFRG